MMNEYPIYTFEKLKSTLKQLGYVIEKAKSYRPIKPVDVSIRDMNEGRIEITDEGVTFTTSSGDRHIGFLYKRKYRLSEHGKPRFHICNCSTIQEFKESGSFNAEYRWANTEVVPVIDLDDGNTDKSVSGLPLCKNCIKLLYENDKDVFYDSDDFVAGLQKHISEQDVIDVAVDVLGYTRDWEEVSRNFKEKHNYTCEKCGLHITDAFDRRYIHCHHRDGNKTNNAEENLECLCINCHSNIDEAHKARFMQGDNKICLQEFWAKYE